MNIWISRPQPEYLETSVIIIALVTSRLTHATRHDRLNQAYIRLTRGFVNFACTPTIDHGSGGDQIRGPDTTTQLPKHVVGTVSFITSSRQSYADHESCQNWFKNYNTCIHRNSIFFKGLLLFLDQSLDNHINPLTCQSTTAFKFKALCKNTQVLPQSPLLLITNY